MILPIINTVLVTLNLVMVILLIRKRNQEREKLREAADEIDSLRNQVHNLNLYLSELLVDTDVYDRLEQRHPGLPGYGGPQ